MVRVSVFGVVLGAPGGLAAQTPASAHSIQNIDDGSEADDVRIPAGRAGHRLSL